MPKIFGLIGYPLTHSFSKKYFTEKFHREQILDHAYELFEIKETEAYHEIFAQNPSLAGLNVTIPYKQAIMAKLDNIDAAAAKIGAVNVIKIMPDGTTKGYNSDYFGFKQSLIDWPFFVNRQVSALVLGNGGAAKAVQVALQDLDIDFKIVSRTKTENQLCYKDLNESVIQGNHLIINTSPIGMYPNVASCPDIPYHFLTKDHLLYDLVYNPLETEFMRRGLAQGAAVLNGLPMLHLQAEKAWEIWNEKN